MLVHGCDSHSRCGSYGKGSAGAAARAGGAARGASGGAATKSRPSAAYVVAAVAGSLRTAAATIATADSTVTQTTTTETHPRILGRNACRRQTLRQAGGAASKRARGLRDLRF